MLGPDYPGLNGITRPRLHEILTSTVKGSGANVKLGVTVAELRQSGVGVEVELTDGTSDRYDLVVGADGINSRVRSLVFPDAPTPEFTGQVVWRYNFRAQAEVDKLWMFGRDEQGGTGPALPGPHVRAAHREATRGGAAAPAPETLAKTMRERLAPYGGLIAAQRELIAELQTRSSTAPSRRCWCPRRGTAAGWC